MQQPLEHWQAKLDRHFQELAREREGSRLPLFAFEHCLTLEELDKAKRLLKEHLAADNCPGAYWLLWVIYATEIGYAYEGDEYWQSFEKETPHWEPFHRYSLKRWFLKFQRIYSSFVPSGPWAEHFSNISWPITHAILPRYLQYQFAGALYQHRFGLAGLSALDSVSIGRLFRTQTYDASTRFEKFLQQEELTGRIVLGLLRQGPQKGQEPIYPAALARIVADLDRVRSTNAWLKETCRTVIDRFRGIGRGLGPSPDRRHGSVTGDRREDSPEKPDIRPSLFLRYSGSGAWAVGVDVPSFMPLASLDSDLRSYLKCTRCRIAGAADTKPAGWTLSGNRRAMLKSWPDPGAALLTFEKSNDILDGLLRTDCRISDGPGWLFRIGLDGRAREIRGRNVHPGTSYILVSLDALAAIPRFASECAVECEGVHAIRISLPDSLASADTAQITSLGLEVSRAIWVWPAGLPCRRWDGQGQSEWLTTEHPQFGFVHDHPVQSYTVYLNDNLELVVDAPKPGDPVFIQLDPLPVGRHLLTVIARRESASNVRDLSGHVELRIREPEPWIPGVAAHAGLIVGLDPHDANLDKLWSNRVDVSIAGPESHAVVCTLSLNNSTGKSILSKRIGGNAKLPVTPPVFRKNLANVVRNKASAWQYLEAAAGKLEVDGGELGKHVILFERDSLPTRLVTRNKSRRMFLYLIDDTGIEDSQPVCHFFPMEQPIRSKKIAVDSIIKGIYPEKPGGLYISQHGPHNDALVVSSGPAEEGFKGLVSSSDMSDILTGKISIAATLRVLAWWFHARLVGFLPEVRRDKIVTQIHDAIYEKICGANWARAEESVMANPTDTRARETLQDRIGRDQRFNAAIGLNTDKFRGNIGQIVEWYTALARRYSVCADPLLCKFAITLAREPHILSEKFPNDLDQLAKKAVSNPDVLRGARCAILFDSSRRPQEEKVE